LSAESCAGATAQLQAKTKPQQTPAGKRIVKSPQKASGANARGYYLLPALQLQEVLGRNALSSA
jgi:hypothetical protein